MKANSLHLIAAILILFGNSVANAHHSHVVEYDVQNSVVIRGQVLSFAATNPHPVVRIRIQPDNTLCTIVLDPPAVLTKRGFLAKLQESEWVEISGYPHRATDGDPGACHIWGAEIRSASDVAKGGSHRKAERLASKRTISQEPANTPKLSSERHVGQLGRSS